MARRVLPGLLAAAGIAVCVALAWRFFSYTMDDAYIYFRYAANFVAGDGLVFNPGEYPRAEGITSPLYALVLAIATALHLDVVIFAKGLGLVCWVTASVLVGFTVWTLVCHYVDIPAWNARLIAIVAALYLMLNPFGVGAAVSGLETSAACAAYALFLYAVTVQVTRRMSDQRNDAAALAIAAWLVPLFRPEMALSVALLLGVQGFSLGPAGRVARRALGGFLALTAMYGLVRFLYYGLPFPLPFYVKQGGGSLPGLLDVVAYLVREAFSFACLILLYGLRRELRPGTPRPILIAMLAALAGQLAYYATIAHIMGFGLRFFLPSSATLVCLAALGVAVLDSARRRSPVRRVPAGVFASGVAVPFLAITAASYPLARTMYIDLYASARNLEDVALAMRAAAGARRVRIALNDCGVIPFYSGLPILDLAGLNNRAIARDPSAEPVRRELQRQRPQVVILVAREAHDVRSIRGWERLSHDDLVNLGYSFFGTITVGTMPDGTGYHLLFYASPDPVGAEMLAYLAARGLLTPAERIVSAEPAQPPAAPLLNIADRIPSAAFKNLHTRMGPRDAVGRGRPQRSWTGSIRSNTCPLNDGNTRSIPFTGSVHRGVSLLPSQQRRIHTKPGTDR